MKSKTLKGAERPANSNQAGAPLLSSLYSESIQILPLGKLAPEIMMELAEISNPSEDIK